MSEEHAVFIDYVEAGNATILTTTPELEEYGIYVQGSVSDWEDYMGRLVVLRETDHAYNHAFNYWEEVK